MRWLRLLEGPHHLVELPIAPTMAFLIYQGERYFRMPGTWSPEVAGHDGPGGAYLWASWSPRGKEAGDDVPRAEAPAG